ncbi:uncharacterized protein LOC117893928 [Drosophila subobscura]|uniref:uncharacterized protein LOC117893928 n=1 Tax=Drosophila subobscura TaxID=7241 RepID=UPI00155A234F|nr:uncharacterized protein LOC117893928 [Drosophila subobscura]
MAYETLIINTYSRVSVKKTYTPSKAAKNIIKMAYKLLKPSFISSKRHWATQSRLPQVIVLSEEELQNSQNDELEAAAPA